MEALLRVFLTGSLTIDLVALKEQDLRLMVTKMLFWE
jgi:hypothetical protein